MAKILGGSLTVYRQTHHNFHQPDTFELDRSSRRWPEANVEQQCPHTDANYEPSYVPHEDGYVGHPESYDANNYYEVQYYDNVDESYAEPETIEQHSFPNLADRVDEFVISLMGKLTMPVVRIGLAIIFFWFGVLKLFDGMSPAQGLVEDTVLELGSLFGFESMPGRQILFFLAIWEVAIGVGLLINRYRRTVLIMLFLQLPGTILPVFLLPSVVWHTFPYGLTLEGQYIVKNLVLVGAALALGSQIRYDEQLARQAVVDWGADEDDAEELDAGGFEREHDRYWAADTLDLSPPEQASPDNYWSNEYQLVDELRYPDEQYSPRDDVNPSGRQAYPDQALGQPPQDGWGLYATGQPARDNRGRALNGQEDLTQELEAFDAFWMTDSN